MVVHQKGRKKTTDAESGVTVGSVAQNSLGDKMSKKKKNEVGLDFYRFQRREAQRNGMNHFTPIMIFIYYLDEPKRNFITKR